MARSAQFFVYLGWRGAPDFFLVYLAWRGAPEKKKCISYGAERPNFFSVSRMARSARFFLVYLVWRGAPENL